MSPVSTNQDRPAPEVGDEQADALRRVSGRVQDLDARVAELDFLVASRSARERGTSRRRLVQAVLRADARASSRPAGAVVGMHVRVDDVRDAHALRARECRCTRRVVSARIDDGALAERPAAEQVGRASEIVVVEDHGLKIIAGAPGSWPAATGSPAARHSGNPSFERRARRPFASSNSTARSAYTQYGPRQYATYSFPSAVA